MLLVKVKSKPKPTPIFKNCSYVCAYQLSYTTQHKTSLIIFPLMLQTVILAEMMSAGGRENST